MRYLIKHPHTYNIIQRYLNRYQRPNYTIKRNLNIIQYSHTNHNFHVRNKIFYDTLSVSEKSGNH